MTKHLVLLSLLFNYSYAWSDAGIQAPLSGVQVRSIVTLDTSSKTYAFHYSIYNPTVNTSSISGLLLDIKAFTGSAALSSKNFIVFHVVRPDGSQAVRSFDDEIAHFGSQLQNPVVPVGIPRGPADWASGLTAQSQAHWSADEDSSVIKPGSSLVGITAISFGLPTIREAIIEADINYNSLPSEYEGNADLAQQLENSLNMHVKVVGPTAPPSQFIPSAAIDYVIGLAQQSAALGWIVQGNEEKKEHKEAGILNSLVEKLDSAKRELGKDNTHQCHLPVRKFFNKT